MSEIISVIVGIYNQKQYLEKVIKGWESQTYKDFALYICDDGSDDGTKEYLETLKTDIPFKYYRQEHKGMRLSRNINQGLKQAKGDYAIFCMGDSVPKPNYLERFVSHLKPNLIMCGIRENVTEDMEHLSWDWRYRGRQGQIGDGFIMIADIPWSRMTGNGLLIPMQALKEIGYWPEQYEGYGCDDNYILLSLYVKGYDFADVPCATLQHFSHNAQEDNPKSMKKFKDTYYKLVDEAKKSQQPCQVYLNFDDFSPVNNNLFFLRKLKENYPNLKVSLFTIPESGQSGNIESFLAHPDLCDELREMDWLQFYPHGWTHPDRKSGRPPEFSSMTYVDTKNYIREIDNFFNEIKLPYQKVFKAPQMNMTEAAKDCFRDEGWTIMIDGEGSWFPTDIKTVYHNWNINGDFPILRKKVISYGHIQDIGNGLVECWDKLLQMPTNAEFKFISQL